MRDATTSSGHKVAIGQEVIYSDGSVQSLCRVAKITYLGRLLHTRVSRIHLVVIQGGRTSYPPGHKFVAKAAERLWVVRDTPKLSMFP